MTTLSCEKCGRPLPSQDGLTIDTARDIVTYRTHSLVLRHGQMQVLATLARLNRPLTKRQIHREIYAHDPNGGPSEKIISVYVYILRQKLEPLGLRIERRGYGDCAYELTLPPQEN